MKKVLLVTAIVSAIAVTSYAKTPADRWQWLEAIADKKVLAWVTTHNTLTRQELEISKDFTPIQQALLDIYQADARLPHIEKVGKFYYNFWQDSRHPRGIWRRTTLLEYRRAQPTWETVLDLDQLAHHEQENWVWDSASCVYPSYDRCLIFLSRGGSDAKVVREFDIESKAFVQDGFQLPEAKSSVTWRNRDSVYVMTDFGQHSMTSSGYPRFVKEWQRGQPLHSTRTVLQGNKDDFMVNAIVFNHRGRRHEILQRAITFFTDEVMLRDGNRWVLLNKPADASVDFFGDWIVLKLRSDWKHNGQTWRAGSLLTMPLADYRRGKANATVLFDPSPSTSLAQYAITRDNLILTVLDDVKVKIIEWTFCHNSWYSRPASAPVSGSAIVHAVDPEHSNDYFVTVADFLTPPSLDLIHATSNRRERVKTTPAFFDSSPYHIEQLFVRSRDGTRIPYFIVKRKNLLNTADHPTLLHGYGGFEVAFTPDYAATLGPIWLARGGIYVIANIRGGGEYGPAWHEAARKHRRQNAYDDFAAVAKDLIRRRITSPRHLGVIGSSNGGLLAGVMLTQHPELFNAVICHAPLLDMRRYHKLLAGASWTAEYGNPDDPTDWAAIKAYSPYHNLQANIRYPRTLFITSTSDDRVHPAHARKMYAAMRQQGADVLYYETIEGGHDSAANQKQYAYLAALEYSFLLRQLR